MKILKILGIVAGVHVIAIVLLFAIQGCSSTSKPTPVKIDQGPPTSQLNPAPVEVSPVTPMSGAELNPATTPSSAVTYNGGQGFYSPTRPGTPAAVAVARPEPVNRVTPAATYTVVKGDSFSKIAAKHHLNASELAKANNLKLSSPLQIGQKLIIPGKAAAPHDEEASAPEDGNVTYTVKSGDSLKLIARHNGTTVTVLKALNHLKSDTIRVGQKLELPPGAKPPPAPTDTISSAASDNATKGSGGGTVHVVKPGEKLGTIAKKYGVTVGELAAANNISDPGKIRAGQQLIIPAGGGKSVKPAPETVAPTPAPANGDLDNGSKSATEEPPVIKVDNNSSATPPASGNSGSPQNP